MVRDTAAYEQAVKLGKKGGNPRLKKRVNPTLNGTHTKTDQPPLAMDSGNGSMDSDINMIYDLYPRKEGRKAALISIKKAVKEKSVAHLLERTKAYSDAVALWPKDAKAFVPHPQTWFNQGRYDDDPETWKREPANGKAVPQTVSIGHRPGWL